MFLLSLLSEGRGPTVSAEELQALQTEYGLELYKRLGGLEGIRKKLDIPHLDQGIKGNKEDIKLREARFGFNKFDAKPPQGFWMYVFDALKDPTLIVLIICSVISVAIGIPTEGISEGWYDGVGILVSILIVVLVTAVSDYRQSLQFRVLEKEKNKIKVNVVRDGIRKTVFNHDLVVGDVVILSTGDQICADGLFVRGNSLTIDESSLTGESESVRPGPEKPFLLAGTMVIDGEGTMLVTSVGMRTEWGVLMSKLSEGGNNETPLQVRLNGVATVVGKIGLAFALLTFFVLLIRFLFARFQEGFQNWKSEYILEIVNYFATSVTILVVAVPEGLPLAVTLSLAYAMNEMMKDNALVRNLAACETMGSATCICSDKTGTLTANRMTVGKVWCAGYVDVAERISANVSAKVSQLLLEAMYLNTTGDIVEHENQYEVHGSPTESAILDFGRSRLSGDFKQVRSTCEITNVEPFSSATKKMLTLVKLENGRYRSHCKGASEIVLEMCDHKLDANGTSVPLLSREVEELKDVISGFAKEALRTICFAFKEHDSANEIGEFPRDGLTLVAIVGIRDPLRAGVKEAVNLCTKAGIKVRMVTGDNIETARAIARDCNILTENGLAVGGPDFRNWSPSELVQKVPKIQVRSLCCFFTDSLFIM
jgi:Ca2+-transporting ATPase